MVMMSTQLAICRGLLQARFYREGRGIVQRHQNGRGTWRTLGRLGTSTASISFGFCTVLSAKFLRICYCVVLYCGSALESEDFSTVFHVVWIGLISGFCVAVQETAVCDDPAMVNNEHVKLFGNPLVAAGFKFHFVRAVEGKLVESVRRQHFQAVLL